MREAFIISKIATENTEKIQQEKFKADRLLEQVIPSVIVKRLEVDDSVFDLVAEASIMFIQIKNQEQLKKMKVNKLLTLMNTIYSECDNLTIKHKCEKIKSIGYTYLVVSGCPQETKQHANNCASLALVILKWFYT